MFHLVVTCVGSKDQNYPGPSITQAIEPTGSEPFSVESLYEEWMSLLHNQLQANANAPTPLDLYQGDTWQAALEAYQEIQENKEDKKLWIISCGFGLVNATDSLCGYKCTFKNGETDSLYHRGRFIDMNQQEVKRKWWELLASQPILESDNPRTIHDLVNNAGSDDQIMIAASRDYLDAIYEDLKEINFEKSEPALCLIGFKGPSHFNPCVPKYLEQFVSSYSNFHDYHSFLSEKMDGCAMIQVHNRAAQYIIRQFQNGGRLHNDFP